MKNYFFKLAALSLFTYIGSGCSGDKKSDKLPYLGHREAIEKNVDGKTVVDSVYQTIPAFSLLDQDSIVIDNHKMSDKIYIADFFFTSCPSICPVMKKQMLRIYEKYKNEPQLEFISHTIDPKRDTIPVLKKYQEKLAVDGNKWHFVYGDRETVYQLARNGYMNIAEEDAKAPGGIMHSGYFILVDKQGHIRGAYNGTDETEVDKLIADIPTLLKEYQQ
ncbi:SCO family protein [Pseudopedobacter sp.]|uniref:SCO family protein n=1 Tax=Pseudopedobacter sp. TaxID=1936787 RepID=UPI003342C5A6